MRFQDPFEFLRASALAQCAARLGQAIGVSPKIAARMANKTATRPQPESPSPAWSTCQGLPSFAVTSRTPGAGGTVHQIDCTTSGDSPGYRSLLIHRSALHCDDDPQEDENHV
jgi:hypothetical protein